ncbi:hypothetical protein [Shimia abyssi]|uniref:Lipoprotein n=1 Tax=Shimia abyssi TaxID=1662395 RepID=A0A2P8FEQ8_9RHOB|nr:hypothetical protein [Shimia abyssi]PSL20203.1 hypothetical protein CLV88_104264 [Shimia abyssi]
MLRVGFLLICLSGLAACGVDGEPWTPTMNVGVGVGTGGVHTSGHVGVTNGPVSISVGGGCYRHGCW